MGKKKRSLEDDFNKKIKSCINDEKEEFINSSLDNSMYRREESTQNEMNSKLSCYIERERIKIKYCNKCSSFKINGAHHCSICKRCVRKMDHHCPWINNCVGENNLRYFILFIFWVFISSGFSLTIYSYEIYVFFVYTVPKDKLSLETFLDKYLNLLDLSSIICYFVSLILCVIFFIFSCFMLWDQYDAVTSGIPGIDALQGKGIDEKLSLYVGLKKNVCYNVSFCFSWFIPTNILVKPLSSNENVGSVELSEKKNLVKI